MRDITLEDTFRFQFTTRAFATGVPTVLAGTPVLSVLEENNATPITAGVTISVDRATVVGLNEGTVIATAANGYEAGKSYSVYISTGTVGGVSVIGEVVHEFTIELAPVNWAHVTAPTTAVDLSATDIQLVDTTTTNTDMRGTDSAALASVATEARLAELDAANIPADIDAIPTTAMRGTDSAALASVCTEGRLAELDAANLPADIAALNDVSIADILASQLTESYAADGVAPTLSQAIFLIQQMLGDFAIVGTTLTVREIDGVTTAATFTLDDATNPTDLTRAT